MKPFKSFDVNNLMHVSILSYAVDLAQNNTLDVARQYLDDRFEVAPLKALEAIFANNMNYHLSPLQEQYIREYNKALGHHMQKHEELYHGNNSGDYPDDFDPTLYDLE